VSYLGLPFAFCVRGVLELGHVKPLLDGLADREPCLWVCLLVDLALELSATLACA